MRVPSKHFAQLCTQSRVVEVGCTGGIVNGNGSDHPRNFFRCCSQPFDAIEARFGLQLLVRIDGHGDFVFAKLFLQLAIRRENRIVAREHVLDRPIELQTVSSHARDGCQYDADY